MKRKQKTFNTEQAILSEIDAVRLKQNTAQAESEKLDDEGHALIRTGNEQDVEEGKWRLKKSGIAKRRAKRCEGILEKLKNALAELRTETLPAIIPDKKDRRVVLK